MNKGTRTPGLLRIFLAVLPLVALGRAQTTQSPLESLPYSPGMLVARAIRAGRIQPRSANPLLRGKLLTCSPGPCVMPTSQASPVGDVAPVNTTPLVARPLSMSVLISGANDYNCPNQLGFYITANTGASWNQTCMALAPGASAGDGGPGVGFDTNGNAYVSGIESLPSGATEVVFETSSNQGSSWSAAQVAVTPLFTGGILDADYLAIDTNPGSPFLNCVYISTSQFDASNDSTIAVAHSCDAGATWTNLQVDGLQIATKTVDQFSNLTIQDNGTVYVSWMRCPETNRSGSCGGTLASMVISHSADGGTTWSTPVVMAKVHLAPSTCGAFFGCLPNTKEPLTNIPVISVDNSTRQHKGNLYAIMYNYNSSAKQLQVQVITSRNGGTTWGVPVQVAPTSPGDEFFPWLMVNSIGKIGATWLDRRNDPANVSYQAYSALCHNGGQLFGATGTLDTSGTAATWVAGDQFGDLTDGDAITINGVTYTVATVNSVSSITLTTSAGTQTDVTFTGYSNAALTPNLSNPANDGFGGTFMGDYTGNYFQGHTIFASWMDSSTGSTMVDLAGGFVVE
ncbi:MAG: sialidase family protein [Candidatus Sulfotelmatobacter sp.]|jgi:hypothetical protein